MRTEDIPTCGLFSQKNVVHAFLPVYGFYPYAERIRRCGALGRAKPIRDALRKIVFWIFEHIRPIGCLYHFERHRFRFVLVWDGWNIPKPTVRIAQLDAFLWGRVAGHDLQPTSLQGFAILAHPVFL